jgi:hypothetical protein
MSEIFKTRRRGDVSLRPMIDIEKASDFMQTHARLLDRRRFELVTGDGGAEGALAALAAHGNADGGFGWALEPDLRDPGSQPGAALHAFEVFAEVAPATNPRAARLCDWLESVSLADGGLPFALPGAGGPGTAPWWARADPSRSSLHITSAVSGMAHRVARHDPVVAGHAWLERATDFCMREIVALERSPFAIELHFVLDFLDAVHDRRADAARELRRAAAWIPESGAMPVAGGVEGEQIRPLDFSPEAGRPLRALLDPKIIAADLERLAGEQHEDGGWDVDWHPSSPVAALEWRGYVTVRAVSILTANPG